MPRKSERHTVCHNCNQPGHHIRDCPEPIRNKGNDSFHPDSAADPELTIKDAIVQLGATSREQLDEAIPGVSNLLVDYVHEFSQLIQTTILQSVKALCTKAPICARLLAYLNDSVPQLVSDFINILQQDFENALRGYEYQEVRILLRFTGCLVVTQVLAADSYTKLCLQLLEQINTEQSLKEVHKDWLIYTVLTSLPWTGDYLSMNEPDELALITLQIDTYMTSKRSTSSAQLRRVFAVNPNSDNKNDDDKNEEDFLLHTWQVIKEYQDEHKWTGSTAIFSPESSDDHSNAAQYSLSLEVIPSQVNGPGCWLRPDLRLFPAEHDKGISPIDRWVVSEFLSDFIASFEHIRVHGVRQMLFIPVSIDFSHLLMEVIMSHMLNLPDNSFNPLYCASLILDVQNANSQVVGPLLGKAIHFIFSHLDLLDLELRDKLPRWFAFHLSNFKYAWNWSNWRSATYQNDNDQDALLSAQQDFIRSSLAHCMRLSYWDRIQGILPAEFARFLPPEPKPSYRLSSTATGDVKSSTKMEKEDNQDRKALAIAKTIGDRLLGQIKQRISNNHLYNWLKDNITSQLSPDHKVKILTAVLCHLGQTSLSHFRVFFRKYADVLQRLKSENSEYELAIIHELATFWRNSDQCFIFRLDILRQLDLISDQGTLNWIFLDVNKTLAKASGNSTGWNVVESILLRASVANVQSEIDRKNEETFEGLISSLLDRIVSVLNSVDASGKIILLERLRVILRRFYRQLQPIESSMEQVLSKDERAFAVFKQWQTL